ncbi:hypothetical protein [Thermococcus nautili]|uniref:Uncharacterized protein n=1 Tax=Thermococcus nautili TaxID=195522 RepID=W8NVS1_9EURY|nr:hypothetical protein [Thermococcus nautili]AHL23378.1 hypothetical protein BD01_1775 [Thermococcus nautili]
MIRKLLPAGLFSLFAFFVYMDFGPSIELILVLPLALVAPLWEPAGYLSLTFLGFLLVYRSIGGFVGIFTLIFAIQYVESIYLAKRSAPAEHYYVLFAGTLLAVPIYYFAYLLSLYTPSFVNTALAAIFVVLLYVLFYLLVRR